MIFLYCPRCGWTEDLEWDIDGTIKGSFVMTSQGYIPIHIDEEHLIFRHKCGFKDSSVVQAVYDNGSLCITPKEVVKFVEKGYDVKALTNLTLMVYAQRKADFYISENCIVLPTKDVCIITDNLTVLINSDITSLRKLFVLERDNDIVYECKVKVKIENVRVIHHGEGRDPDETVQEV